MIKSVQVRDLSVQEATQSLEQIKSKLLAINIKGISLDEIKQIENSLNTIQNQILFLKQDLIHKLSRQQKNESL